MYQPTDEEQAGLAAMAPPDSSGLTVDGTAPTAAPMPTVAPAAAPAPAPAPVQMASVSQPPVSTGGGYNAGIMKMESGGDPNATNPITHAHGTFQFLPSTFRAVIAAHPELQGLSDSDPKVMAAFTADNAKILTSQLGHAPSQIELTTAHFLGAQGAVTFLKGLAADPNASIEGVVNRAALNANRGVFYNGDGTAKTIGAVYGELEHKIGLVGVGNAAGSSGGTGTPGQPGASGSPSNPFAQQGSDIKDFISGQPGMWAKLQSLQDEYKKAAAPTWQQKMEDAVNGMQQQMAVATANKYANAGAIMSHVAQPDASQFVGALQSTHNMNVAERARDQEFAKTNLEMGSSTIQAKNAMALQNLGLTGGLANSIANYGNEQRKLAQGDTGLGIQQQQATTQQQVADTEKAKVANELSIAMLKYPTEQAKAFQDILDKQVPDPNAQATIMRQFIAGGGNPSAALPTNIVSLNKIITAYTSPGGTGAPAAAPAAGGSPVAPVTGAAPTATGPEGAPTSTGAPLQPGGAPVARDANGLPIATPAGTAVAPVAAPVPASTGGGSLEKPGKQLQVTWFDPATNQPQRRVIDENNPSDQQWMRTQKPPNATTVDLASPTTTVNTGGAGEGSASSDLADQHMQAISLKQDSDAALSLLPYLKDHGGTGVLTGTDGTRIANAIKQATGFDATGVPAREIYDKLMTRIQTGLTLPQMKQMGARPAAAEFAVLMKGQIGDTATIPAVEAFLKHTSATADWTQRSVEAQSDAAVQAKQQNNPYFDPVNARIKWQKQAGNQPPVWDGQKLIEAVEDASKEKTGTPAGNSTPLIPTVGGGFYDWARSKIGGGATTTSSPTPAATGAPTPVTQAKVPTAPGRAPLTDKDRELFNGGNG